MKKITASSTGLGYIALAFCAGAWCFTPFLLVNHIEEDHGIFNGVGVLVIKVNQGICGGFCVVVPCNHIPASRSLPAAPQVAASLVFILIRFIGHKAHCKPLCLGLYGLFRLYDKSVYPFHENLLKIKYGAHRPRPHAPHQILALGHGLIVDSRLLVIQHKGIVTDTAFHQITGNTGRVLVYPVILQLGRGHGCHGMGNHKAKVRGKAVGGNLDDLRPVKLGDHAPKPHIFRHISFQENILGLLHQKVSIRRYHDDTPGFGNLGIIKGGVCLENLTTDVFSGKGNGGGFGASTGTHHAIGVGVHLRDHHFPKLTGQRTSGLKLTGCFVRVQLVNGKGEGTILLQGHFLGGGIQTGHGAEPAPIRGGVCAGAVIVVHGRSGHLVNLDGVRPRPIKVIVGQQGFAGFRGKLFIHQRKECSNEINSISHLWHFLSYSGSPIAFLSEPLVVLGGPDRLSAVLAPLILIGRASSLCLSITVFTMDRAFSNASGLDTFRASTNSTGRPFSVNFSLAVNSNSRWANCCSFSARTASPLAFSLARRSPTMRFTSS
nr:MAG TPA: hypothetical protein [Caudoviricetes sp.]